MPSPGMAWRHVIISTRNAWLPGDRRGWRSRRHKRHSSGDYRHPPPPGEHEGLYRYSKRISGERVDLPPDMRPIIGQTLIDALCEHGRRVIAASVDDWHAHLLVELPDDMTTIRRIVGDAKCQASRAVRRRLPGRVWAAGGTFKRIASHAHHREVFGYILDHALKGAWTWSYRDDAPSD